MSIEENKGLVRRDFTRASYHPEVCSQIFVPHVIWNTLCHISQPDLAFDPQAEKAAYVTHAKPCNILRHRYLSLHSQSHHRARGSLGPAGSMATAGDPPGS